MPKIIEPKDLQTVEERVIAAAHWLDVEPPEMTFEGGEVVVSEDLISWVAGHHVCFNWIGAGCIRSMFLGDKERRELERSVLCGLDTLDATETQMLLFGMKAARECGFTINSALEAFKQALEAYRAGNTSGEQEQAA